MDKNESKLINEINKAAKTFAEDNISYPTGKDYILIVNAMMVGSSIAFSHVLNEESEYFKKNFKQ